MKGKRYAAYVIAIATLIASFACSEQSPTTRWSTMLVGVDPTTRFTIRDEKSGGMTTFLCSDLLPDASSPGDCEVTWGEDGYGLSCTEVRGAEKYRVMVRDGSKLSLSIAE